MIARTFSSTSYCSRSHDIGTLRARLEGCVLGRLKVSRGWRVSANPEFIDLCDILLEKE